VAISLTIPVVNVLGAITAGYTHIKVYRSSEQNSGFSEITTPTSVLPLISTQTIYSFIDGSGTTEHWYLTALTDMNAVIADSTPSNSFRGDYLDTQFPDASYPEEFIVTPNDRYIVDVLRTLIGDPKELTRDYISEATSGYDSISADGYTHSLLNPPGWPVKIELDSVEYTDKTEPVVAGYKFITFSGVQIDTTSGVLDLWYYHFRYSDAELLRVFNSLVPPPELNPEDVTFELASLCAAINLLESELRLFGVNSGIEVDIFEEIRVNPKGGVDGRSKDLAALLARKKALIAAILAYKKDGINGPDLCGILID